MQGQGQVPHKPTEQLKQLVQLHTIVGTRQDVLAKILGIDVKTMHKYYREELDIAKAQATAQIGGALFKKAMSGDTAAMIFWMKTQARWRETVDISNEDGSLKPEATQIAVLAALAKIHESE